MTFKHTIKTEDHEYIENSWTIPKAYYTSEELFELEKEKLFAKTWVCVAHVSEVAEKKLLYNS
ncbi:MAG: phenylpropionate dioxygenase-like ring-hydroxylating dioxygenase large terminal subunit [Cocleimonas sp.]|jgi:phenylpropionate dioxygenase-like ring-hydroxylating dioxygenase large terminal subunit